MDCSGEMLVIRVDESNVGGRPLVLPDRGTREHVVGSIGRRPALLRV